MESKPPVQPGGQGRFSASGGQTAGFVAWGRSPRLSHNTSRSSFSRSCTGALILVTDKNQSLPESRKRVSEYIINTLEGIDFRTNLSQKSRSRDDVLSPSDLSAQSAFSLSRMPCQWLLSGFTSARSHSR
jgi:hypothetical protein